MQLYNYVRISCFTLIVDLFSKKSVKKLCNCQDNRDNYKVMKL